MNEEVIKDLLYFCYLNDIDIPGEYIKDNKKDDILSILKEKLDEEKYLSAKRILAYYTHSNGKNKIDLSELPLNEDNEVEHINNDYKSFIGKKLPFVYKGVEGVLEIISLSMLYMVNGSEQINEGYKVFEEKYNSKELLIIDRYMVRFKGKTFFLSTKELLDVNLEKLFTH